jgi:hypothetical protein
MVGGERSKSNNVATYIKFYRNINKTAANFDQCQRGEERMQTYGL